MPAADRYLALLRGVNVGRRRVPMAGLARVFEDLGLRNIRTLLNSGNVVFTAPGPAGPQALTTQLETALRSAFGFDIPVILRPLAELEALTAAKPFAFAPPDTRLNVTFLGTPPGSVTLPSVPGVTFTRTTDREICSAVATSVSTLTLMDLLEKTCGKNLTTRRWDTVQRALAA